MAIQRARSTRGSCAIDRSLHRGIDHAPARGLALRHAEEIGQERQFCLFSHFGKFRRDGGNIRARLNLLISAES